MDCAMFLIAGFFAVIWNHSCCACLDTPEGLTRVDKRMTEIKKTALSA